MHMGGVDIPNPLVEAHATGQLVIFVGAGASIPPPSFLPSFKGLVETIRDESNLQSEFPDLDNQPLDEVLGRIADEHGVDVHDRVYQLTNRPKSRPSPVHNAIVKLASSSTIRIVTTNYDRHLSTLLDDLGQPVPEYLAPALPIGDDFTGIVYIHGRLDQEHRWLISTDDDFGKAYLTDAWAARFLDRMFATRPVLFVGYSHRDTIMKYLARGLGGRAEKRYVLTDDSESGLWRQLGITPIQCAHDDLAPVLDDWATKASGGLLGHRAQVKALVYGQDPSLIPESMSYLETIVADKNTIRFFTENARGNAWLQWTAARPEFATLFYPAPAVDPAITHELANWFADQYITDDQLSDAALQIVAEAGTYPGIELLYAIARRLATQDWPVPERMRRWLLIITSSPANRFTATFLASMLTSSSRTDDPDTALFLFDYLTEPTIKPSPGFFGATFEPVTHDDNPGLHDVWNRTFKPALADHALQLLDIFDRHLRRADLQLSIASESDRQRPSIWRPTVAALSEHELSGPLSFLIDAARQCIETLLTAGDPRGHARLESWTNSGITLLRRLAVYGWTIRADRTSSEKLEWFRATGWLTSFEIRGEATYLITQTITSAGSETVAALVSDILAHSDDDKYTPRWAYALLTKIDEATPDVHSVRQALATLTTAHPDLAEESKGPTAQQLSAWATAPPTTADELHDKIDQELDATIQALIACETETSNWDDQQRWDRLAGAISSTVQQWPSDGFSILDAVGAGHPDIDVAVLRGWAMTRPEADLATEILSRIEGLELAEPILGYVTAMLGVLAFSGSQSGQWYRFERSVELAKKCWEAIHPDTDSYLTNSDDLDAKAINHPAGHLAQFWLDRVSYLWGQANDAWDGIPPEVADYLAELIADHTKRSEAIETVFGGNLSFFYEADADWCMQYLWPMFDWSADEARARRVWNGYLSHGGWAKQLLIDGLLEALTNTVSHREDLGSRAARNLPILLAKLAVEADIDPGSWIRDFLTTGSPDDHTAWAESIGHQLKSLDPKHVEEQWDRWIRDYVTKRTNSVPRSLDPRETSAMARWVLFLTDSMAEAIDLLLPIENAGFELHTLFLHDLNDAQIERAPEQVAKLVAHLLKRTKPPFHYGLDLKKTYAKFKDRGVSDSTLHEIAEAAMQTGIELD